MRGMMPIVLLAITIAGGTAELAGPGPVSSGPARAWKLNDTGQSRCYDGQREILCPAAGEDWFGQDAQHGPDRMAFRDNGDGTVSDLTTGLTWTKAFRNPSSWEEAVQAARALEAGGHHDWRLPTIKELYSLVDFSGAFRRSAEDSRPFLDPRFEFEYGAPIGGDAPPGAPRFFDAQYWTATRHPGVIMFGDSAAFGVNFADGRLKAYPLRFPDGRAVRAYARYVRGPAGYGVNAFEPGDDGTILDRGSGLAWQRGDSGVPLDWEQALAYADTLSLGGHDDWRLPNAKELQSLVDYARPWDASDPRWAAIDPRFQVSGPDACYWTGTTLVEGPPERMGGSAAYVAFGRALGWMRVAPEAMELELLDVHGAGAQRADPKRGDPARYPAGRGPQGDVVRIRNYVRCVRG